MQLDSTSHAIAGSRPVGSPWKVTVSVPPLTGVVLAGLLELLLELLLQAVTPATSAVRASSITATIADLRTFIPYSLPHRPLGPDRCRTCPEHGRRVAEEVDESSQNTLCRMSVA